jgi:hypothetical protein
MDGNVLTFRGLRVFKLPMVTHEQQLSRQKWAVSAEKRWYTQGETSIGDGNADVLGAVVER